MQGTTGSLVYSLWYVWGLMWRKAGEMGEDYILRTPYSTLNTSALTPKLY